MNMYLYILAMALTTYLIRVLPMTIFRKPIKSRFLRSFLYYGPYCCLTANVSLHSQQHRLDLERRGGAGGGGGSGLPGQEPDRGRLKQQRRGADRGMGDDPFVK